MKKKSDMKFSWCPVCMVHTYHKKVKKNWCCTDWHHEEFLRLRTDAWIEDYRQEKIRLKYSVKANA